MARPGHEGICEHCGGCFGFELVHCGQHRTSYAYCDGCGSTALLPVSYLDPPELPRHRSLGPAAPAVLADCPCGAGFSGHGVPRCPHCAEPLDAELAARYIEPSIRRFAAGWSWQRNWTGLYCIVIERRVVAAGSRGG